MLSFSNISKACSVFCIDKNGVLVTGRSYDWSFGDGYIIVNKRGQFKTAFRYWEESSNNLAAWTSKYGSITFVQYGREIAFDGMNEAGLVVSELWLEETVYPSADSRPDISVDQYVQYMLDNFKSVNEIIANIALIRIRPVPSNFTKIHFFVTDSSGNSLTIEFLDGQMVYHTGETMSVEAITNDTYENSIEYINRGVPPNPDDNSSLEKFFRISYMLENYDPELSGDAIAYALKMLDSLKVGTFTKFQTVFDIKNRVVYFKSLQNPQLRYFRFDAFDFSCDTVSKMLNINADLSGDVTEQFSDYDWQANETMIKTAWEELGSTNIYPPALQIISRYPETFECTVTDADETKNQIPRKFELNQNYPNPFNPSTGISYKIHELSYIELKVFNLIGREMATLVRKEQNAGNYEIRFDGSQLSSGVYLYQLKANNIIKTNKMLLMK
jgi:choloylglycine hydrolase